MMKRSGWLAMMECALLLGMWVCVSDPADAQWQVPNHAVPVGKGAGTGFGSAGPCTAAQLLAWPSGNTVDPSCITGLPSGSLANPSASIGLTANNGSATTAMRSDASPALSQAIAPTWTGVHTFTDGNSVVQIDGTSWGQSTTRLGAAGAGSTANQFGLNIQLNIAGASGATAAYEKAAAIFYCQTADNSSAHNLDCVGSDSRGYIANNIALGRAWGGLDWAQINSGGTGDGLLVGREIDIYNNGTDQASVNTTTSKYGLTIYTYGSADTTAAILVGQGSGSSAKWHKVLYADPAHISTSGNFIELAGILTIDKAGTYTGGSVLTHGDFALIGSGSGQVTIHAQAAAGTYNFNVPTTAGTTGAALLSGGGGGSPMTWTAGALSIASGKTFTSSNTITLTAADGQSFAMPSGSQTLAGLTSAQNFTGLNTFTASRTSGIGGIDVEHTQTQANGSDTNDMSVLINYTLTANTGTELVASPLKLVATNNLTGGGAFSNLRTFSLVNTFNASTTTTSAFGVYVSNTGSGTVGTNYAFYVESGLVGTTKWAFYDAAQVGSYFGSICSGTTSCGTAGSIVSNTYQSVGTKIRAGGAAPALTSCGGGSPAISGSDLAGEVTMGTTATGCIITFNAAYSSAPYCVVTWQATPLASQSYTVSTTAITTVQTSTSSNKLDYVCIARSAG